MRKTFIALAIALGVMTLVAPSAATAALSPTNARQCVSSDTADVQVNSAADMVTITDDPSTGGNNFGCYTNFKVTAGQTITFDYTGDCGGGVPRVFVRFAGGQSENTFDSDPTCSETQGTGSGTVTYTLVNSGKIKSFAFINDRGDSGTVTYSNLVIGGTVVNF